MGDKAVTEIEKGTMSEEEGRKNISPSTDGKTPGPESKVSPGEEELKIYTQREHEALLHASNSEEGRIRKTAEDERDTLKTRVSTLENELEDNTADITTLTKKLDNMASGDPTKFDVVEELKAARLERKDLKAKLKDVEGRETAVLPREKKVNSFEREVLIETIAEEYEDGDGAKLKNAVKGFEAPTEEQIRQIADIFWKKKEGELEAEGKTPKKSVKPFSGRSDGGSPSFTREQIADREFWEKNKDEILKAQAEGRIK